MKGRQTESPVSEVRHIFIWYSLFSHRAASAVAAASPLELSADDGKVRRRPEDGGMTLTTRNKDK